MFYGCTSLTEIEIPNGVTGIGGYAFSGCTSLTEIEIPNGVMGIGGYAFSGCTSLTEITIPSSVTNIGEYVFKHCSALTSITVDANNTVFRSIDGVLFNLAMTNLICYPGGKDGSYTIPDGVNKVSAYAFYMCEGLTEITVPVSVTSIGNYAFYNCLNLTSFRYGGTTAQWTDGSIILGSNWKYGVPAVKVVCSDGTRLFGSGHSFGEWTVTRAQTCTELGEMERACSCGCGEKETQAIPLHIPGAEATCTTAQICTVCGEELTAALGHTPGAEATCTTAQTCTVCGEELAAAFGHQLAEKLHFENNAQYPFRWEDGVLVSSNHASSSSSTYRITAQSACTLELQYKVSSEGNYDYLRIYHNSTTKDSISGESGWKRMTVSLQAGDTVRITYSKDGSYSNGSDCGYVKILFDTDNDLWTEATEEYLATLQPLCEDDIRCAICNELLIEKAGHTPGAEATCTDPQTCTVCGEELTAALGHTPGAEATCTEPQICTVCGEELVSALGHTPGAEATCTEAQTCTVCGEELAAALGHSHNAAVTEPTCTEQGYTTHTCVCGDTYIDAYVEALGHTPGAEATCTEAQTCTVCGEELAAALGHTPGAEATCTAAQTCTVCGEELTAALGHTPGEWETVTAATKKENGLKEKRCAVCEALLESEILYATGSLGLAYTVNTDGSTCTVIGIGTCTDTALVIPEKIDGYTVTAIAEGAFAGIDALISIEVVPGNASYTAVDGVLFNRTKTKLICYPAGKTESSYFVPASVTAIGDYAFVGCDALTSVEIHGGVTKIGKTAFGSCGALSALNVAASNGSYRSEDGVLFNKAATELICYPAGKTEAVYEIPATVTRFADGAFAGCGNIRQLIFRATAVPAGNPFEGMEKPETVYVPAESYEAYVSAWSGYLGGSVRLVGVLNEGVENLTVSGLYSKTAVLTWAPFTGAEIVGYVIKRDGVVIADTAETSWADRTLSLGTSYAYTVYGYTADGTVTAEKTITVTPVSPEILNIRTNNAMNKVGVKDGKVHITVSDLNNLKPFGGEYTVGTLYYADGESRVLIGTAVLDEATAVYTVDWDISGIEDGDYTVIFVLEDVDGATAEYSETLTVDHSVPEKIINVITVGGIDVIHVNWGIASEIGTVYRVYRRVGDSGEFELIAQISDRDTLTYADRDVEEDLVYTYYVVGVNDFGQESDPSDLAEATLTPDTESPAVTKLNPQNGKYLNGTVTVTLTAEDNFTVAKTQLYYSLDDGQRWILLAESANASFAATLDTAKLPDGKLKIKGIAYDAAGNESAPLIYVFQVDNTGPEQVKGLASESTSVTVTLSWDDVADNDISYYRVEIRNADGTYTTLSDIRSTLGINIYGLTPATPYTYRVVGYDVHGNRGIASEDITVTTQADTTAPVISQIRPTPGYYSDKIDLRFTAADDHSIGSILVQISTDGQVWTDLHTETYGDISKNRTLSYVLSLDGYEEGFIYLRAVATDMSGNESASDASAPFVQHVVDRTAPQKPADVTAEGNSGYIEISWTQGSETDLDTYSVYRAGAENGTYTLVKSGIDALNFFDRNVEPGETYFYRVTVCDKAGNESEYADTVSASVSSDTEKPVIHSIYPAETNKISASYKTVSVLASDNNELDSVLIQYSKDGSLYGTLKSVSDIHAYNTTVAADLNVSEWNHGETVFIRVTVTDASGNTAVSDAQYTVDFSAPTVDTYTSSFEHDAVHLVWVGNAEEDLSGYRVYRKVKGDSSYRLIAQKQAIADGVGYMISDNSVTEEAVIYVYKIEATDKWGNTSFVETEIALDDRSMPKPVISCEPVLEVGVEYLVDASSSTDNSAIISYRIDFGDGTVCTDRKAVHKYTAAGTYTITLTVTDDSGNVSTCTKEITVKERTLLGSVNIRVVDENGKPVPRASVYFNLGEETQVIKYTDNSGYVSFTAEVGNHTVGAIIANNEWLPVKKEIVVTAGAETTVTMTMVHHVLVEGSFEINRMTFEEILAAGIDVTAPENQYFVEITVYLRYRDSVLKTPIRFNVSTGEQHADPIYVGDAMYVPRVLKPPYVESGPGEEEEEGDYLFSEDVSVILFEIPVEVSSLKEFFNVRLHIMNNAASEFSMLENVITLNVPDGMTIMDTFVSEKNAVVKIDEIKGQTTETISWILRGDEVGEYWLSADYSGILSQFNAPVYTEFVAEEPIKVYGLSNLKLLVEVAETLDHATLYYNVSLINQGHLDVYLPHVGTDDTLIEIELIDERGRDMLETMGITIEDLKFEDIHGNKVVEDWVTSLIGDVGVLKAGYAIRKHYMCVDQSSYSEKEFQLTDYWYEMQNSYGLQVEIVPKPVSYFKSYLNATVNAVEKAADIFDNDSKQHIYEYIMDNDKFMYWEFFENQGYLLGGGYMPSEQETRFWDMLKLDFSALLDLNDDDLVQAIILDTLELTSECSEFMKYQKTSTFLGAFSDFLDEVHLSDIIEDTFTDIGKELFDEFGEHVKECFKIVAEQYKWEFYKCFEMKYESPERFLYIKLEEYTRYTYTKITITEKDFSQFKKRLFSEKGFEKVWETIGFVKSTAEAIVDASRQTELETMIFIVAQAQYDSYMLFLDSLITYLPQYRNQDSLYGYHSLGFIGNPGYLVFTLYKNLTNDADIARRSAKTIKSAMEKNDPVMTFLKNTGEEFWEQFASWAVDQSVDAVLKGAGLSGTAMLAAVKIGLGLTTYIGDNVFNFSERNELADNIRYLSLMTLALQDAINVSKVSYEEHPESEQASFEFLQLLYYLLNMRSLGESQAAQIGASYDVFMGDKFEFSGRPLFEQICKKTKITNVKSWYEWRDVVEDRLSLYRVELFKNPVATEITGLTAPVVTFDYSKEQTAQSFSDEYAYSLDGGNTWQQGNGGPIKISPQSYEIDLIVERIDKSNTDQVGMGYCTVYGIPSLMGSGIVAVENSFGYLIDNLDNDKTYEVTFSKTKMDYGYGESLSMQIPAGSYSFLLQTEEEYEYIYIRSLADANSFASYTMESVIIDYQSDCTVDVNAGKISNVKGDSGAADLKEYCGMISDSVTVTTPDGEESDAIGTGYVLNVDGTEYEIVVTADVNGDAEIDVFDLFAMLSHVNSEEELSGLFFEAGCVLGNEEIDIFDIFSTLSYMNTGEFSE